MYHQPRDLLSKLANPTFQPPSSLDLHAVLYRLCETHAGELDNLLGSVAWQHKAAAAVIEIQSYPTAFRKSWLPRVRLRLAELAAGDPDELLIGCSAILYALDRFHRDLRPQIRPEIFELPPHLGGGRTAFLPPPENPIADRVPKPRRLARRRSHLKHDLGEILDLWWHLVVLDRSPETPRFLELDAVVSERLRARWEQDHDLSIALAAPLGDVDFDFYSDPDRCHHRKGIPYRFVALKAEHEKRGQKSVDYVLEACAAQRADLLCFPELTLDSGLLRYLRKQLRSAHLSYRPALVVAGSFHLRDGEGWVNRCHVLDGRGSDIFIQDKCKGFEITPDLAREMGPDLCQKLGVDERGGFEEIRSSAEVVIADCALGRLMTPICLDFCGEELRGLLLEARVNFLLVPAMTPRMGAFVKRAYELGTQCRGSTFVANSAWLFRQTQELEDRDQALNDRWLFLGYVPVKPMSARNLPSRRPSMPTGSEILAVFSIRELLSGT